MVLPLHGRTRELDLLDSLLGELRAGHGRALVLRGEPGAGKTALLDHLTARAPLGRARRWGPPGCCWRSRRCLFWLNTPSIRMVF